MNFKDLKGSPRLLMEVELEPIQGSRFQPTGFADLGAAVYQGPNNKRMLLVESAQSIANRLEQTCLNGSGPMIADELKGLSYIHVKLTGNVETETSSLVEAHRINSPYIISNDDFKNNFKDKAGYAKGLPLDWKKIAAALFYYDPNALIHGAFMANLEDGRIKVPRALTGFIEAEGIREAASGGVKNNQLDPTGTIRAENYDKNVYGNVPYHRMEYTADRIMAYFNFDLALLDGYGLEQEAHDLLVALGLYKISKFLSSGLRLRTACDLKPKGAAKLIAPAEFIMPDEKALLSFIQENIKACASKHLFADPPVTEIVTPVVLKEAKGEGAEKEGT
jgi:CRISPR-associated protein Csb1